MQVASGQSLASLQSGRSLWAGGQTFSVVGTVDGTVAANVLGQTGQLRAGQEGHSEVVVGTVVGQVGHFKGVVGGIVGHVGHLLGVHGTVVGQEGHCRGVVGGIVGQVGHWQGVVGSGGGQVGHS